MSTRKLISLLVMLFLLFSLSIACARNPTSEEPRTDTEEPPVVEAMGYAGSTQCAPCHKQEFDGWEETLHRLMVQDGQKAGVVLGDFNQEGNPFEIATEYGLSDILYTIGSSWKQRYVVQDNEAMRILPMQWIVKTESWTPYYADEWQERDWLNNCVACHTTGYNPDTREIREAGIGCEACHGPGQTHIESRAAEDIINPANLSLKEQTDICGQCHVRGDNRVHEGRKDALGFMPGDDLLDVYIPLEPTIGEETDRFFADGASKSHHQQWQDHIQSAHYLEDAASCSTCHESHSTRDDQGRTGLKHDTFEALCTSCHIEGGSASPLEPSIDVDKYMPFRAKSAVEEDIRSHTFDPDQPGPVDKKPYVD